MGKLWRDNGTKILGIMVVVLGTLGAASPQIHELLPPKGDTVFDLLMAALNYLFIGAGAAVIRRGFTNSAASNDPPGA